MYLLGETYNCPRLYFQLAYYTQKWRKNNLVGIVIDRNVIFFIQTKMKVLKKKVIYPKMKNLMAQN